MKVKLPVLATLLLIAALAIEGCKKDSSSSTSSIYDEIAKIKAEPVRNPPGSVWQYEYNNQVVYFIPARCCDIPSQLFDSKGNLLCCPDGGITGGRDGRCKDFFDTRKNGKLFWQDDRY